MSIGIPYTDHTVLISGKYKLYRLGMVPSEYLLNIHKNPKGCVDKALLEYIEKNLEEITTRPASGKIGIPPPVPIEFICDKVAYASKKIANQVLRKIRNINDGREKPVRSYECEECNQWHLTAVPYDVWKKKVHTHTVNTTD